MIVLPAIERTVKMQDRLVVIEEGKPAFFGTPVMRVATLGDLRAVIAAMTPEQRKELLAPFMGGKE